MLNLPYGSGSIPFDGGGAQVLRSRINTLQSPGSGREIVKAAMAQPIGSSPLRRLAEAMDMARAVCGAYASVTVIPTASVSSSDRVRSSGAKVRQRLKAFGKEET